METERTKQPGAVCFVTCMNQFIERLKVQRKFSAMHIHVSALHSLMAFAESRTKDDTATPAPLLFSDVFDAPFLKSFQEWLLLRNASWATVSTYMRRLRATYNATYAEVGEDHNAHLFDEVYTTVDAKTKRALKEEEMSSLITTHLSSLPPSLRSVLAYFLLMFQLRGMPFIDLAHLRKKDLNGNILTYCRHKTGKQITVRIPREAWVLFEQFKDKNPESPYLFPILNASLTDEWDIYCCYQKALRKFNKKLVLLSKLLLPKSKISSYTARHTWATLMFHQGVTSGIISKALGHSSIRVTESYLKPFENEVIDDSNDLMIARLKKQKTEIDNNMVIKLCKAILGGALLIK